MDSLDKLKNAKNLHDLAPLLGYKVSKISYILFVLDDSKKYREFSVPKKNSTDVRKINAPNSGLALIQARLAELLANCILEIQQSNVHFLRVSHGFQNNRTILTNARVHVRKRFVFNVDIENFFGSINFGRVRGFFIKDPNFALDDKVATLIAQIACYNNSLPQGSPCSPVISNLIGNRLDINLSNLAKTHRCHYSRYADDLTFSTNLNKFPPEIAIETKKTFEVGKKLKYEIKKCGFKLNDKKTRMNLNVSRQVVTGLTVNKKVNINIDYFRMLRSNGLSL